VKFAVLEVACVLLAAVSVRAAATGSPWPTATPAPASSPEPSAEPTPKGPITKERALEIARQRLAETKPEAAFEVLEKKTVEKPFGWVFFYQPRAAAADRGAVVPGAGPLVVHRDGSTTFLSSSVPPRVAIEEYEKAWAHRKP
jgi:hypothetical protein